MPSGASLPAFAPAANANASVAIKKECRQSIGGEYSKEHAPATIGPWSNQSTRLKTYSHESDQFRHHQQERLRPNKAGNTPSRMPHPNCQRSSLVNTWLFLLPALVLCLIGCRSAVEHPLDQTTEEEYQVDPTASVTVRNTDGSIVIHGSDSTKLTLRTVKKAKNAERLRAIAVNVTAQSGSVSIATNLRREKNKAFSGNAGTVDYAITAPRTLRISRLDLASGKVRIEEMRGESVRASVVDGELAVHNCFGKVDLDVGNGEIDVNVDRGEYERFFLNAQIIHGNFRLSLPGDAPFHIKAETSNGKLVNDFADMVDLNGRGAGKIDISQGREARSEIKIRVITGDIKIARIPP